MTKIKSINSNQLYISQKIEEYIRNRIQEDLEFDQMSLKEYIDPFTGEPVPKGK